MALFGGEESLNIIVRLRDEASEKLGSLGDKVSSFNKGLEPAISASNKFALGLTAIATAAGGFAVTAIKAAGDMDALTKGMIAVSGSSEKAQENITKLREVAKLPGLGFREAIQGSINLQAAGLSAETSERALKSFGNALATVGKGRTELDGVVLALQQISSKGVVSAEEINQLNERLPQIRQAMQAAFGTADTEALKKMGIRSDVFIEQIIQQFEKLPPVANSFNNSVENLKDAWDQFLMNQGSKLLVWAQKLIDIMTVIITDTLPKWIAKIEEIGTWFSQHREAIYVIAGAIIGALVPAVYAAATAFIAWGVALAPFLITGAVIGGLVAGILWVIKNWDYLKAETELTMAAIGIMWRTMWDNFSKTIDNVWDGIKTSISNSVNWVLDKVNTMINAMNSVSSFGAGLFGLSNSAVRIPNIPKLAEGGIVNSPTIAMIGEAGPEAVVPLSKMGGMGGGVSIVINNPSFNSREDEDRLMRTLDRYFRPLAINNKL